MAGAPVVGPVGPVGPVVPPVVTVPAPLKVSVMPVMIEPAADPVSEGNEPVAPAYVPVPPVTVAEPLPEVAAPVSSVAGIERVPVMVPPPPESVMVKGALTVVPVMAVRETVELNVPLPILIKLAVPVADALVPEMVSVAVTVNVVLTVAA